MTNHFYGSSLFQARKTDHHHRHSHLHGRSVNHLRSHAHYHRRQEENETADLDSGDPTITEVVQTISVVQVIDGSGAIIETQTFASDPQTNLLDAETGSTIDTGFKAVSLTSDSAGAATTSSTATETPISSVDPVSATSETTPPSASPSDVSLTASSSSVPPAETTDATTSVVPTFFVYLFLVIFVVKFLYSFKFHSDYRYLGRKLHGIPVAFIAGHDPLFFIFIGLDKRHNFKPYLKLHLQLEQPHDFLIGGIFFVLLIFRLRFSISVTILYVWHRRW
ncbi:hypothetical protein UCDDA912_g03716 [Diaporthe ampelina]|uniref:Uncharacterized protein n=1 Tax=Diaporthe ampelina TaxID=1214573 RepID=A0A0G2FPK4_9PEZI|nr:hypothetical protein UCDDA912_g03716 [Diaporthe ampelina]